MIEQGIFREDLLYRINTVQIQLPPLREREDDLILLAEYFLKDLSIKYHKPNLKFNTDAIKKISSYSWPGNVRELMHSIERAVILSDSEILNSEDFQFSNYENISDKLNSKVITLEEGEKIIIKNALLRNNNTISETANELKIGRQTLYRKIEKYDL